MYVDRSINEDDCNLFSCLSRNPWLAQWIFLILSVLVLIWILTTTLILSILVLMWICCDTMATAVLQYIPAEVSLPLG
uniref:Transmembrane protein 59 n=1 Tax=Hucho hucho TaxID=62062 RepID=A0A4W5KX89_9TELE